MGDEKEQKHSRAEQKQSWVMSDEKDQEQPHTEARLRPKD